MGFLWMLRGGLASRSLRPGLNALHGGGGAVTPGSRMYRKCGEKPRFLRMLPEAPLGASFCNTYARQKPQRSRRKWLASNDLRALPEPPPVLTPGPLQASHTRSGLDYCRRHRAASRWAFRSITSTTSNTGGTAPARGLSRTMGTKYPARP